MTSFSIKWGQKGPFLAFENMEFSESQYRNSVLGSITVLRNSVSVLQSLYLNKNYISIFYVLALRSLSWVSQVILKQSKNLIHLICV